MINFIPSDSYTASLSVFFIYTLTYMTYVPSPSWGALEGGTKHPPTLTLEGLT